MLLVSFIVNEACRTLKVVIARGFDVSPKHGVMNGSWELSHQMDFISGLEDKVLLDDILVLRSCPQIKDLLGLEVCHLGHLVVRINNQQVQPHFFFVVVIGDFGG